MTITYHATGMRTIQRDTHPLGPVQNAADAAKLFAARLARRQYGKRGVAAIVRTDSWTEDGSTHNFEIFIGREGERGEVQGHNEWLHVHTKRA